MILVSCSQKKISFSATPTEAQEIIFQMALKNKLGFSEKNVDQFYYPPALDKFFFRHTMENGKNLYLIEKYYPECIGKIDCYGFTCAECDNGSWVVSLLDSLEEERLADELIGLLEDDSGISISEVYDEAKAQYLEEQENLIDDFNNNDEKDSENIEETEQNPENINNDDEKLEEKKPENKAANNDDIPVVEKLIIDSKNRLKNLEYGQEIFVTQKTNEKEIIIHADGTKVVRNIYDLQFRLVQKEIWEISGIKDSKLVLKEVFEYEGTTNIVKNRAVKSEDTEKNIIYNENGLPQKNQTYSIFGEKKLLQSETIWKYNKDGKITEEENIEYKYIDEKLESKSAKKQVFIYNDSDGKKELPPDYEYYENDVLKMRTEYSSKSDYVTKIYFDDGFVVSAYYKDNVKIKDVYSINGLVKRTKIYEQKKSE